MSNFSKSVEFQLSEFIVHYFDVFESGGAFWVRTKAGSSIPDICCELESYKFACLLKWAGSNQNGGEVSCQMVKEACQLVIGRSIKNWCLSNPVTEAIDKNLIVNALVAFFEDWRLQREARGQASEYTQRFNQFYDEFRSFVRANFIKRFPEFPRSSNVLSRRLSELSEIVEKAGLSVCLPPRDRSGRRITISAVCDEIDPVSSPSDSPPTPEIYNLFVLSDASDDSISRGSKKLGQEGQL